MKKLITLMILSLSINTASAEMFWSIHDNDFDAALGPVSGYPQDDVVLTGQSVIVGNREEQDNHGRACYVEAGDLDANDYTYNGQEHHADVTFVGVGCRIHLGNKSQFVRPILGLNYASGNSNIDSLNLNYDFYMPSVAAGIEIKPFDEFDLSFLAIIDYADNDGGKYQRIQLGLSGYF